MSHAAAPDYGPGIITRVQARIHARCIDELAMPRHRRRTDLTEDGRRTRRLAYGAADPLVYRILVEHQDWRTGLCNLCHRTLAAEIGCSPGCAAAGLRRLEAGGWITSHSTTVRTPHGLRWVTRYTLLLKRRYLSDADQEAILAYRLPPLRRRDADELQGELVIPLALGPASAPAIESMRPKFDLNPSESKTLSVRGQEASASAIRVPHRLIVRDVRVREALRDLQIVQSGDLLTARAAQRAAHQDEAWEAKMRR